MHTCLITNRIREGYTGSAGAFAAWTAWFERLGGNLADRGNPAFTSSPSRKQHARQEALR